MMRPPPILLVVAGALLFSASAPAQAQTPGLFLKRQGYEQADFSAQTLKFKARDGDKTVRVTVSKVRLPERAKAVPIELPKRGLALVQHAAGTVMVATGQESLEPLEGEWLRIPLPAALQISTDKDTVLLDLVIVEELEAANASPTRGARHR
jgi:hypothetical protein